jgi:hypothetical protein
VAILFACQKEITNAGDDSQAKTEKKYGAMPEGVKVPIKDIMFHSQPFAGAPVLCQPEAAAFYLPHGFNVGGTAGHTGTVQMENSPFYIKGCGFTLEGKLMMWGDGTITADNGDKYYYTSTTYTNLADGTFTGTVIMDGGTGRFEGVKGEVTLAGQQYPQGGAAWTAEGYLIMAKK